MSAEFIQSNRKNRLPRLHIRERLHNVALLVMAHTAEKAGFDGSAGFPQQAEQLYADPMKSFHAAIDQLRDPQTDVIALVTGEPAESMPEHN